MADDINHGLAYIKNLKIGDDELEWLQFENNERTRRERLAHSAQTGLVLPVRYGAFRNAWRVFDSDDDGSLSISKGDEGHAVAYDSDGYAIVMSEDADEAVTVVNDATWYTLVMRRQVWTKERGTLTLTTSSATVVGSETEFTRYRGYTTDAVGLARRGTRIRIDAADSSFGNEGEYEIDTNPDDVNLTFRTSALGTDESGIDFYIKGDFAIQPVAVDGGDIHKRVTPEFALVAQTRIPADGDIILYDVKRDDGAGPPKVTLIDRRHANRWRAVEYERRLTRLVPLAHWAAADPGDYFSPKLDRNTVHLSGANLVAGIGVAPGKGQVPAVAVVAFSTADEVVAYQLSQDTRTWSVAGTVISSGVTGITPTAIERLPANHPNGTHVCIYVKTVKLYRKFSTDQGTTWGSEALIWDPTLDTAADKVFSPGVLLTRRGRLIIWAQYEDNSAPVGQQYDLRYIYSDDYGTTWNTNINAGFTMLQALTAAAGVESWEPHMAQDPITGTIWTVSRNNASTKIRIWESANEDLPDTSLGVSDNGKTIGEEAVGNKQHPVVYPGNGGQSVIFAINNGTDCNLHQILTGYTASTAGALTKPDDWEYLSPWIRIVDGGSLGAGSDSLAICQRGGLVFLLAESPAGNDSVFAISLLPTEVNMAGGRFDNA